MLARLIANKLVPAVLGVCILALSVPAFAADKDKEKEEAPEEIEDKQDPNQPKATAGGLYSLETYPLSELERTLTMPAGVFELTGGIGIDLTESVAFKTFTPGIGVRYGLSDVLELQAGGSFTFTSIEGLDGVLSAFAGIEFALAFDLIDARFVVDVPFSPDVFFNIGAGLPLKFRVNKQIAILGLEEILIVHTGDQNGDGDTDTPDLLLSVAGLYQVIDPLAIILRASLFVGEFKFSDKRKLPIDLDIQYSVSNMFDVGVGVSLSNLAPPEGQGKATDSRSFRLFANLRFGK